MSSAGLPAVDGDLNMLCGHTLGPDTGDYEAVLEMDLADFGRALDLSADDWAVQVAPALTALYGDLDPGAAIAHVSDVVCARAAQLAAEGASSLLLVATGDDAGPIAVGAVFVQPAVRASISNWRNRLEPDGWLVSATSSPGVPSVSGTRTTPIPGAGLRLAEHVLVIPTRAAVFVITLHAVRPEFCRGLSDLTVDRLLANVTIRDLCI